jgi:GH35 family endo-1,4-beta-xylanase
MEEKFPDTSTIVGVTCGLWAFDYPCGIVVDREFSYITPENDFKQLTIHPNNSDWNFNNANTWIEHTKQNKQILRMHCPIGPQVSDWTEDDSRTAEELEQNMTDFMTAVCTTFNNIENIKYMDVVNETVKNGAWFGPVTGSGEGIWENPWTKIGFDTDQNQTPLYIKRAFQLANQYAPGIKQLYNHHEGPENTASWDLIKETIIYLKNAGIRVDAVGWQAHVDNGWTNETNLNALSNLIDWAQNNNLEFHITEASAFIKNKVSDYELNLQAETYAKILNVLLAKSNTGKVGWNTWHLTDAYTYRSEYLPSLFNENCEAKPAYYAVQTCLENFSK